MAQTLGLPVRHPRPGADFPKDAFYYYQIVVGQTNPVLAFAAALELARPGRSGNIRVVAYSNCRQVELFLNGASLGRQEMQRNSDLVWQVK